MNKGNLSAVPLLIKKSFIAGQTLVQSQEVNSIHYEQSELYL